MQTLVGAVQRASLPNCSITNSDGLRTSQGTKVSAITCVGSLEPGGEHLLELSLRQGAAIGGGAHSFHGRRPPGRRGRLTHKDNTSILPEHGRKVVGHRLLRSRDHSSADLKTVCDPATVTVAAATRMLIVDSGDPRRYMTFYTCYTSCCRCFARS